MDWSEVLRKESSCLQCTKCGNKPRGQPAMSCSKCKAIHGDWSPNPVGLLVSAHQQKYSIQKVLTKQQNEVKGLRKQHENLTAQLGELETQFNSANTKVQQAKAAKEQAELKALKKGPETKMRANKAIGSAMNEVEEFSKWVSAAMDRRAFAEKEFESVEAEYMRLEQSTSFLEEEVSNLQLENSRIKDTLVNAVRGDSPSASPPSGMSSDIWGLIMRGNIAAAKGLGSDPSAAWSSPPSSPPSTPPVQINVSAGGGPSQGPSGWQVQLPPPGWGQPPPGPAAYGYGQPPPYYPPMNAWGR